jgi:hypothetical protein
MCGCSRGGNAGHKKQIRTNGVRRPFVSPPPVVPTVQMQMNAMPQPQVPLNSNDRRRIQQLNQAAIRRSLNK